MIGIIAFVSVATCNIIHMNLCIIYIIKKEIDENQLPYQLIMHYNYASFNKTIICHKPYKIYPYLQYSYRII